MAFTNEEAVRLKFRLESHSETSSALVEASIAQAHAEVLSLTSAECLAEPPALVVVAETLLAGAALLESLAARWAVELREARLSGHQLDTGRRFPALRETAAAARAEGLRLLTPWLRSEAQPSTPLLLTSPDGMPPRG